MNLSLILSVPLVVKTCRPVLFKAYYQSLRQQAKQAKARSEKARQIADISNLKREYAEVCYGIEKAWVARDTPLILELSSKRKVLMMKFKK